MILRTDDHGAVGVLTMDRPQARNALSTELFEMMHAALLEADREDSVRAWASGGFNPQVGQWFCPPGWARPVR